MDPFLDQSPVAQRATWRDPITFSLPVSAGSACFGCGTMHEFGSMGITYLTTMERGRELEEKSSMVT